VCPRCAHGRTFLPRLNRTLVDELEKPESGELVIMDTDVPCFGVRVMPSGARSYFVRFRIGGGRRATTRRETLGRHPIVTPEKARQRAKDILARARIGEDPAADRRRRNKSLSVAELVEEWIAGPGARTRKGRVKSPASFASDKARLTHHVVPTIGRVKLCDLRRSHVERVRDAVASGKTAKPRVKTRARGFTHVRGGEGVATRTVACFSTLLGYAVDQGLVERNVALGVHRQTEKSCERFLSAQEITAFTQALQAHKDRHPSAVDILLLLLLTGCRYSEVAGLRWDEVQAESGLIMLKEGKTGARPVYVSEAARDVIAGVKRFDRATWVFPASRGNGHYQGTPKIWRLIAASAGLKGVRIHDLRHTFASTALAEGVSLELIAKLLGHRELRTTARYAHLAGRAAQDAANKVGAVVIRNITQ
jgi:integrase